MNYIIQTPSARRLKEEIVKRVSYKADMAEFRSHVIENGKGGLGKDVGKETFMLFAAGLVYESVTNREGPSQYQLNDNGILFVKYGLRQSVEGYKRETTRIPGMLTAVPVTDFKQIFDKGNGK